VNKLLQLLVSVFSLTIFVLPALAEQGTPRDLYYEQMDSPKEALNTGMKYWIELRRGNSTTIVDNRTKFKSGDQIRVRIVPNVSGYAYVVMMKGTSGNQSVLFPNNTVPNNRVVAGKQYSLPSAGFLKFDNNPGTETLRVLLSRKAMDKTALLKNGVEISTAVALAAPEVKENQLVAYPEQEKTAVDIPAEPEEIKAGENNSKDLFYEAPKKSTHARKGGRVRHAVRKYSNGARKIASRKTNPRAAVQAKPGVTVINLDPAENLGADIQLTHG
jgi:hypothetical protein